MLIVREQDESTICSPKVGVPELVFALLNRHPGLQDERILIRSRRGEYTVVSELEVNEDGRVILTSGGIVN